MTVIDANHDLAEGRQKGRDIYLVHSLGSTQCLADFNGAAIDIRRLVVFNTRFDENSAGRHFSIILYKSLDSIC